MGNHLCACFHPQVSGPENTGLESLSRSTTIEHAYYEEVTKAKNLVGEKHKFSSLISLIFSAQNLPIKTQENGVNFELYAVLYESNEEEYNKGEINEGDQGQELSDEKKYFEICRTEIIDYSDNFQFETPLNVIYDFERLQFLKIVLFMKENMVAKEAGEGGSEGDEIDMSQTTQIGQFSFILSDLLLTENEQIIKKIESKLEKNSTPIFSVQATEKNNFSSRIELLFHGTNLSSKDGLETLSPFLLISQKNDFGEWDAIYRSEVRFDQDEAHWKVIQMTLGQFNLGDVTRYIKIEVKNWDEKGQHEIIGSTITDTRELLENYENSSPMEIKNSNDVFSGYIFVRRCEINPQPALLDYFQAGTKLNLMIGIDYTASNGEISNPNSLHYFQINNSSNQIIQMSQYEEIIRGIGVVLEPYLGGKEIKVWGFGGSPSPTPTPAPTPTPNNVDENEEKESEQKKYDFQEVQQDFQIGSGCLDVEDVVNAYQESLSHVSLSGPGLLSPIIKKATEIAKEKDDHEVDHEVYHVLLIITDGQINHDSKFLESLIAASQQPLSIIIFGIGDENFDGMSVLDTDSQRQLEFNGITVDRDILQFIKFQDYVKDKSSLYEKVLGQITQQFMEFMKKGSNLVPIQATLTSQGPVTIRPLRSSISMAER